MTRTVARNVLWNGAGLAIPMLAGFVVAPLLVQHLGDTRYGLWILILSLTGYFNLLDLGVAGSVGRNIAYHRARDNQAAINATLSTAFFVLCGVACLVMAGNFALVSLFFHLFPVPPDEVDTVRLALTLVGLGLALTFPLSVFDATLWGQQRFDLINAVEIPVVLARAGLTFVLILNGYGLVELALLNLAAVALAAALKAWLSFRNDPFLRLRPGLASRGAAGGLFGFGVWSFVLSVTRMVTEGIGPNVIGARLGVGMVTPHSVAAKLVGYAHAAMVAGTEVLTPVATGLHAGEHHDKQQQLVLQGGKFCLALSLFFLVFFLLLGQPFLELWMGPKLGYAAALLTIMAVGECWPMSQLLSQSVLLGMHRHRELALMCLLENVAAVTLALCLVGPWGLAGVCWAVAGPAVLCRGLWLTAFTFRQVDLPLWRYPAGVVLPALLGVAPAAGLLALLVHWQRPDTWPVFVAQAALYGLAFLVSALFLVVGYDRLRTRFADLLRGDPEAAVVEPDVTGVRPD